METTKSGGLHSELRLGLSSPGYAVFFCFNAMRVYLLLNRPKRGRTSSRKCVARCCDAPKPFHARLVGNKVAWTRAESCRAFGGHGWAVWPHFGPHFGVLPPLRVTDAATHEHKARGPKARLAQGTTGVTHHQGLGHEPRPAPEPRITRIREVLVACLLLACCLWLVACGLLPA